MLGNMLSRTLNARSIGSARVEFRVMPGEDLSESEMERELLRLVYEVDPALEDETGRLRPGARAAEISTSLFVVGPDADGWHYLGGIQCAARNAASLAQLAISRGFEVQGHA